MPTVKPTVDYAGSLEDIKDTDVIAKAFVGLGDVDNTSDAAKLLDAKSYIRKHDIRISLSSTLPVPLTDITGAGTLYCHPFEGELFSLYNSTTSKAELYQLTSPLSYTLSGLPTASRVYDFFISRNSGTPVLTATAWNSDNVTRATALAIQAGLGFAVKSGSPEELYIGSAYVDGSKQITDSSVTVRRIWNKYNRRKRQCKALDTAANYTYSTNTWRAKNANTTDGQGRFTVLIGEAEDIVDVLVTQGVFNSGNTAAGVGIAVDVTNANHADMFGGLITTLGDTLTAKYRIPLTQGLHFIQNVECGTGSGTTSWVQRLVVSSNPVLQHGMSIEVWQ